MVRQRFSYAHEVVHAIGMNVLTLFANTDASTYLGFGPNTCTRAWYNLLFTPAWNIYHAAYVAWHANPNATNTAALHDPEKEIIRLINELIVLIDHIYGVPAEIYEGLGIEPRVIKPKGHTGTSDRVLHVILTQHPSPETITVTAEKFPLNKTDENMRSYHFWGINPLTGERRWLCRKITGDRIVNEHFANYHGWIIEVITAYLNALGEEGVESPPTQITLPGIPDPNPENLRHPDDKDEDEADKKKKKQDTKDEDEK